MQPTIPQDVAFVLPLIAAGLTHYLISDRLAPWKNALIAIVFLIATALACAWLSGNFLLGSPQASVLAILAYVVVLMQSSLRTILLYLESIPSPFDAPAPPAPANPNPVRVPTPLVLPSNVSPIQPSTSAPVAQDKPPV